MSSSLNVTPDQMLEILRQRKPETFSKLFSVILVEYPRPCPLTGLVKLGLSKNTKKDLETLENLGAIKKLLVKGEPVYYLNNLGL